MIAFIFGTAMIVSSLGISRIIYKRLLSPISLWGCIWGIDFVLLSLPLIEYRPIGLMTYTAVLASSVALLFGALSAGILPSSSSAPSKQPTDSWIRRLRLWTIVTNVIATIGIFFVWGYTSQSLGKPDDLSDALASIYGANIAALIDIPRWASYMSAVSLAGATFTGLYTAYAHRTAWWVILWATANAVVLGFVTAGRLTIIWSTALFINGYLAGTLRSSGNGRRLTKKGVARALGFTLIALFFFGVMVGVRQVRGGSDNFSGSTRELIPYSPVLRTSPEDNLLLNAAVANYFYVTGSIPALDYRLAENTSGDYYTLGSATFASVFRLVGVDLPRYEEFSPIPMPINVYTSLGDWYKDFGWPGIVGIAYLLGICASYLYQRALSRRGSTTGAAILAFLLLWVEFSVFFTATFNGAFWVALLWSIIAGVLIDFRLVWRRTRKLLPQVSRSF